MSELSVLTLVKNRAAPLQRLIEGLDRSRVAPSELVIVDMSDAPVEAASAVGFPIRIVRLATDGLPLAEARNLAARRARGSDLLFLDVDCIPSAGLTARMAGILAAENALVCASVGYLGPDDVDDDWTEAGLTAAAQSHPVRTFPDTGLRPEPNAGLFWSLAFGVRRGAFEALGGFDERYSGYGAEDTDFGFRCREAGLPLLFAGGLGAFHQHHGVWDPPLQHFEDIVRNAQVFHDRWALWPMEGWLDAFAALGLIAIDGERIVRLRAPRPDEIANSRQPSHVRF